MNVNSFYPWIQTYTGKRFDVSNPDPDAICIEDIAHSLSLACRYNGHSRSMYSVAQHSVLMSTFEDYGDKLWLLLHDAAEAYIGDIVNPIKHAIPIFTEWEHRILFAIQRRFLLDNPDHTMIKQADEFMLSMEKRDVLNHDIRWDIYLPKPPSDPKFKIIPWTSNKSERLFLERYYQLSSGMENKRKSYWKSAGIRKDKKQLSLPI